MPITRYFVLANKAAVALTIAFGGKKMSLYSMHRLWKWAMKFALQKCKRFHDQRKHVRLVPPALKHCQSCLLKVATTSLHTSHEVNAFVGKSTRATPF